MLAALLPLPAQLPAQGAERIQFFFGPFEPTVYVEDLETFAETGVADQRLAPIVERLSEQQQGQLRGLLNAQSQLSPIPVSQFTYSPFGENLLEKLGQVIQTDSFLNGMKGIRAALILAAADEENGGFTLLNAIRHFPTDTVQIDSALAMQIFRENEQIFSDRDRITKEIRSLAQAQSTDSLEVATRQDPQLAGSYQWAVEPVSFQNPNRSEPSIADLYLPLSPKSDRENEIPVVAISHGVASDRQTFAYLAEHLASHGYAAIVLEHSETSAETFFRFLWGQGSTPSPREFLLRPQDITAALDTLSEQQATDTRLSRLNLESVGLLGHSLGGHTVLALGGAAMDRAFLAQECQSTLADRPTLNLSIFLQCTLLELPPETPLAVADARIGAVIALNPVTSKIFGMSGLQQVQIPVLVVAGTNDLVAPALPEQIEPFNWLATEEKKLVLMENGTHFSFLDRESRSVLPFSQALTGPDPMAARAPIKAMSVAFFDRYLQDQPEAEQFLSQAYINTFPTDPFQFNLVSDFSEETRQQLTEGLNRRLKQTFDDR